MDIITVLIGILGIGFILVIQKKYIAKEQMKINSGRIHTSLEIIGSGRKIELCSTGYKIGRRKRKCGIDIGNGKPGTTEADLSISREHAWLELKNGRW